MRSEEIGERGAPRWQLGGDSRSGVASAPAAAPAVCEGSGIRAPTPLAVIACLRLHQSLPLARPRLRPGSLSCTPPPGVDEELLAWQARE